jgi:hypothetical protein
MRWAIVIFALLFLSCQTTKKIDAPQRTSSLTGNDFYHQAFAMKWKERDSFALKEILAGNIPSFLKKFERIKFRSLIRLQVKGSMQNILFPLIISA